MGLVEVILIWISIDGHVSLVQIYLDFTSSWLRRIQNFSLSLNKFYFQNRNGIIKTIFDNIFLIEDNRGSLISYNL